MEGKERLADALSCACRMRCALAFARAGELLASMMIAASAPN
jgi:hypothetical protein